MFFHAGSPLALILAAGEWRSPALLAYFDQHRLGTSVGAAAREDESDESEC